MSLISISGEQLAKFFVRFYKDHLGKYQRLGQAFCNEFNITDPFLFYEADDKKATELINQYLQESGE